MRIPENVFSKLWSRVIWQIDIPLKWTDRESIHVDLGSGITPRNPFQAKQLIATDFHAMHIGKDGTLFVKSDLTKKLPFKNDSISSFSAYDVLEHIPRWERVNGKIEFPFINLMNEIYRCLKPGGYFLAVTPYFPRQEAFQDPTHINMITKSTIRYFANPEPWAKLLGYNLKNGFDAIVNVPLRGSGPVSQESQLQMSQNSSYSARTLIYLRLFKRFIKLFRVRKPSHLLWVLKKSA